MDEEELIPDLAVRMLDRIDTDPVMGRDTRCGMRGAVKTYLLTDMSHTRNAVAKGSSGDYPHQAASPADLTANPRVPYGSMQRKRYRDNS
jgi:hypothetical protein